MGGNLLFCYLLVLLTLMNSCSHSVLKGTGTSQSSSFSDVLHCQLRRLAPVGKSSLWFTQDLQKLSIKFIPRHFAALDHHTWWPQKIVSNVLPVRGGYGYAQVSGLFVFKKSITVSVLLPLKIRKIFTLNVEIDKIIRQDWNKTWQFWHINIK